jgi:hypothetical protein
MTGRRLIDRPIIILGCNRSGTTLLFNNLSWHPGTWSLYIESQDVFYRHHPIDPEQGDRLVQPPEGKSRRPSGSSSIGEHTTRRPSKTRRCFDGFPRKALQRPLNVLYKQPTPSPGGEDPHANALRVPFLKALFPDARFVFLVRRGEAVVELAHGRAGRTGRGRAPATVPGTSPAGINLVPPWMARMEGPSATGDLRLPVGGSNPDRVG